jgi:hypothetical protein
MVVDHQKEEGYSGGVIIKWQDIQTQYVKDAEEKV